MEDSTISERNEIAFSFGEMASSMMKIELDHDEITRKTTFKQSKDGERRYVIIEKRQYNQ